MGAAPSRVIKQVNDTHACFDVYLTDKYAEAFSENNDPCSFSDPYSCGTIPNEGSG